MYLRKKEPLHATGRWCPFRPSEAHVLSYTNRSHVGDVWVCPDCRQVWIAVLRPSMLDAVPHWSVKWKRMCILRAQIWIRRWEQQ